MVGGRRIGLQQRHRQKRQLLLIASILSSLAWMSLWIFHLKQADLSKIWIRSPDVSGQSTNSLCESFLNNIPIHRFYPKRFFENGGGRPFLPNYNDNCHNFTDILNARFLVFQPTFIAENECSIVFFHIHKNGGTTLERHVPLPTNNFYSKREKELGHERFEASSKTIMNMVWNRQQTLGQSLTARPNIRTFTFLRDPVPRFLSSVTQVLKLRVWHKRLHPCYERNNTEALLDCVLDKLETGSIPEMHLAPQSFELYKQVMGYDIYIELLDLNKIEVVMEQLGAQRVTKERSTTGSLIRRFPNFRLTMEALDKQRIKRICDVYAADVRMINESKVTTTICLDPAYAS